MTQLLTIVILIIGYYGIVFIIEISKTVFPLIIKVISKISSRWWFFIVSLFLYWLVTENFILTLIVAFLVWLLYSFVLQHSENKKQNFTKKQIKIEGEKRLKEAERKEELSGFFKENNLESLGDIYKNISKLENELCHQSQKKFNLDTPFWSRKSFSPYPSLEELDNIKKNSEYMYINDVKNILKLTPAEFNWSSVEQELISNKLKYPEQAPSYSNIKLFSKFLELDIKIKPATFEYDKTKISNEDLNKYFSKELENIFNYNKEKEELEHKIEKLNNEINLFNKNKSEEYKDYLTNQNKILEKELANFNSYKEKYEVSSNKQSNTFIDILDDFKNNKKDAVIKRLSYIIHSITLPKSIPISWEIDFDTKEQIAIIDLHLPDVVHNPPIKQVELKSGLVDKPLSITEKRDIVPNIHPAILLRIAYEIFRNDSFGVIKLLVLNGWIKFDDQKTGQKTKAFTASLMVEKEQVINLNLSKVEPLIAFLNLKGKSAGKLVEIIPITPVMSLDKKDKRFISTTEVLNKLGSETNLASMDWQDFESLIAQLFEKEFAKEGAEVKVTQASRDRGVDAVIFDPDPIRGGKIIVQAKRYANTVDVSAVRDLCAVVKKEGAIKGILVTTSTYGGDAYQFANNEPVTLLNGAELLGLLKKHGYTFRINLEEARSLNLKNKK